MEWVLEWDKFRMNRVLLGRVYIGTIQFANKILARVYIEWNYLTWYRITVSLKENKCMWRSATNAHGFHHPLASFLPSTCKFFKKNFKRRKKFIESCGFTCTIKHEVKIIMTSITNLCFNLFLGDPLSMEDRQEKN